MSELRTAKRGDVSAFPGSTFVVDDTPPIAQCQEAILNSPFSSIADGLPTITNIGDFIGIDLAGKIAEVIEPLGEAGDYNVLSNTDDVVTTDHTFGDTAVDALVLYHDAGEAYITRNESSFQRFTESLGKAHTTKGGQLFVDVAAGPMADACTDTFDPQ